MLAAVRKLKRLERVGETKRDELNEVATVATEWLKAMATAAWYERYGRQVENYGLRKTEAARKEMETTIGEDGKK